MIKWKNNKNKILSADYANTCLIEFELEINILQIKGSSSSKELAKFTVKLFDFIIIL